MKRVGFTPDKISYLRQRTLDRLRELEDRERRQAIAERSAAAQREADPYNLGTGPLVVLRSAAKRAGMPVNEMRKRDGERAGARMRRKYSVRMKKGSDLEYNLRMRRARMRRGEEEEGRKEEGKRTNFGARIKKDRRSTRLAGLQENLQVGAKLIA